MVYVVFDVVVVDDVDVVFSWGFLLGWDGGCVCGYRCCCCCWRTRRLELTTRERGINPIKKADRINLD